MVAITTRAAKGSPLTNTEMDTNLTNLNDGKVETTAVGTIASQNANNVAITGGSVTGITDLVVADGGTGRSTLTAENVLLGDGTNPVKFVAPGTNGNVLRSNGTTWASSADTLTTTTGSPPYYGARAWVNFNGTTSPPTIRASGNVSSITKNSTGDYTVNFTTAMPDTNYCVTLSGVAFQTNNATLIYDIYGTTAGAQGKTTNSVRVVCSATTGAFFDVGEFNVVIFR